MNFVSLLTTDKLNTPSHCSLMEDWQGITMKLNTLLLNGMLALLCVTSSFAQAGILKSTTGVNITERHCPKINADFDGYVQQWGDIIVNEGLFGRTHVSQITPNDACVFNTQWERFFPGAEPGTKTSLLNVQDNVDQTYIENIDGDIWLSAELDNTDLALPEAHFVVNAQQDERNSATLFSAQSFLWQGATTTLNFSAVFDFSKSIGQWGTDSDSYYFLDIGASTGMTFAPNMLFPDSWGNELSVASYSSENDSNIVNQLKNFRQIDISFEVNDGDEFQLWGESKAFALNGGWVDSANTMRTTLAVEGLSQQESEALFAQSLTVVPSIPEPATIALFIIALTGLVVRQGKQI